MKLRLFTLRSYRVPVIIFLLIFLWHFRRLIRTSIALATVPLTWSRHASRFIISAKTDGFDVTFANYSRTQDSAGPAFDDKVPPVFHHIALGGGALRQEWLDARKSCLDLHPGWHAYLWTDETAGRFITEYYPAFKQTWDSYRYPIQKIDALRYLALYEHGGVVLDMDLKCKRALGPLRRFEFVAPAANPTGFSIGFMMASKQNPFIGSIVQNLRAFNTHWLWLPYTTVMFSTGCHFASTIHTMQRDRTNLKILAGPPDNPHLHRLSGDVSTPLFHHLGSSSWHSYDAAFIVTLGHWLTWVLAFIAFVLCSATILALVRYKLCRRPRNEQSPQKLGKEWEGSSLVELV